MRLVLAGLFLLLAACTTPEVITKTKMGCWIEATYLTEQQIADFKEAVKKFPSLSPVRLKIAKDNLIIEGVCYED